jgi:hypothetical protein
MLDFNHRPSFADKINWLIDDKLEFQHIRDDIPRNYLGASRLGVNCSRALQYEYTQTLRDKWLSGRTLRIFEMGHALEKMALNWLGMAGFEISTYQDNGEPFGFATADGKIQGHVDGIIRGGLFKDVFAVEMAYPALWECKSMNAKAWKQTVDKGMKVAKPIYAVQIAIYQAYMEEIIPGVSKNPALFTAVNKDTSELYHELVPFDAGLAQAASDKAVNILRATQAGETLPRISADPEHFECRFCDWQNYCWQDHCWKEAV